MNVKFWYLFFILWLCRVSNFVGHFRVDIFGAKYLKNPISDFHENIGKNLIKIFWGSFLLFEILSDRKDLILYFDRNKLTANWAVNFFKYEKLQNLEVWLMNRDLSFKISLIRIQKKNTDTFFERFFLQSGIGTLVIQILPCYSSSTEICDHSNDIIYIKPDIIVTITPNPPPYFAWSALDTLPFGYPALNV